MKAHQWLGPANAYEIALHSLDLAEKSTNVSKQAEHIYDMIYIIYMPFHIMRIYFFLHNTPSHHQNQTRVVREQNQNA